MWMDLWFSFVCCYWFGFVFIVDLFCDCVFFLFCFHIILLIAKLLLTNYYQLNFINRQFHVAEIIFFSSFLWIYLKLSIFLFSFFPPDSWLINNEILFFLLDSHNNTKLLQFNSFVLPSSSIVNLFITKYFFILNDYATV